MRASRHFHCACQVSKNTIELFENNSINQKRDFWLVQKLGFKGFKGRPWNPRASNSKASSFLSETVLPPSEFPEDF